MIKYEKSKIKYEKLGNAGIEGILFQVNLLTLCMLNAVKRGDTWRLSTENKTAGHFDDLVLESSLGDTLLQAKHRQNKKKKITLENLFSTNSKHDDFSLPKYFLSYQEMKNKFKIQNIIICTNASIDLENNYLIEEQTKRKGENILHLEDVNDICCITLHTSIISELTRNIKIYYDNNYKSENISEDMITHKNIEDFVKRLQFIANYPSGVNLDECIVKIISQLQVSNNLDSIACFKYIHAKMMQWFKEKDGRYLTQADVYSIFCEIRSNNYCEVLKQYNIFFEEINLFNQILPENSWRILHIVSQQSTVLSTIKTYQALQENILNVLFLNLNEDCTIETQMIDAFSIPRYTCLVISSKPSRDDTIEAVINKKMLYIKLTKILSNCKYKKVILIAGVNNKLAELWRNENDAPCQYHAITEAVLFSDLAKHTKEKFLQKEVIFQGTPILLTDLLGQIKDKYLNYVIDEDILIKLAKNKEIRIGCELKSTEYTCKYYIPRTLSRFGFEMPEENMHQLTDLDQKVVLISDTAGMGKSTVLTNIMNGIKLNSPNYWIVRIDLSNYTKILFLYLKRNIKTISVRELLNSQETTRFQCKFEERIFTLPKKVVLMVDGLDEISPDYIDIILDFIVDCQESPNFAKIFVTTRPHLCKNVEHKLKTNAFTLNPFQNQNQVIFLKKYWVKQLMVTGKKETCCEIYAQALITEISKWIDNKFDEYTFAEIPLHTRMLAEVFQEHCQSFLVSNEPTPILSKKIDLFKIYQMFIDKKRQIFIDRGNPVGATVATDGLKNIFNECNRFHHILALKVILNKNDCDNFTYYRKHHNKQPEEKYLLKVGVVQKANDYFIFIHRTFAEYFVAESLLTELKSGKRNKYFQKFLLDKVFIENDFNTIRSFLDSFLQNEHMALPHTYFSTNRIYRLVKTRNSERVDIDVKNAYCRTPLHQASRWGNLEIVRLLVDNGANLDSMDEDGRTALHDAARWDNLEIVKFLVENNADINRIDVDGRTALHSCARMGYMNIVKFLIENGVAINTTDKSGTTALQEAIQRGQLDVVEILVAEELQQQNLGSVEILSI